MTRRLSRSLPTLIACAVVVLVTGCGSSSSGGSSSSTSGSPSSTVSGTGSAAKGASGGESVKFGSTPKYASPSSSSPVRSGTVQIAYRNITIQPDTVKVKVGSTIKWTNYDSVEHNVTSEGGPQTFASGNFGEGHTFQVKVTKPGVIHYECTIHPQTMNGTIEVVK